MRIVSTIDRPLADEHVIAVDPVMRPALPGAWRRRINPFPGRALSAIALTAEQEARGGIQRLRGQSVTRGIVDGLDLAVEAGAETAAPGLAALHLFPGFGLTAAGEDVTIGAPRRIVLGDLPVYARADRLDRPGDPPSPAAGTAPEIPPPGGAFAGLPAARARRYGPTLRDLIADGRAAGLPRVAVLVAEAVTVDVAGRVDALCPPDPRDDGFDDRQRIDGTRLALFAWPDELVAAGVADYSLPPAGPAFRNRLAYRVFEVERGFLPGEAHPWDALGVALGLIAFTADFAFDFLDRSAVARSGGQPRPRTPLVDLPGSATLHQARLAQWLEQLAGIDDLPQAELALRLRHLPPVGVLPAGAIDFATRRQTFFPPGFGLSARPVPAEDVNAAVSASAGLLPIDLGSPADVELLVPVPARVYEPGLLETASVDPDFPHALARFTRDRTDWLVRRELVRRRRDILADAVTGRRAVWAASDASDVELAPFPDRRAPASVTRVRRVEGAGSHDFAGADSTILAGRDDALSLWVRVASDGPAAFGLLISDAPAAGPPEWKIAAYWGDLPGAVPLPLAGTSGDRRVGDAPPPGTWARLDVPARLDWRNAPGGPRSITASAITGVSFVQGASTIEWGPLALRDARGGESIIVGDDAPAGSTLHAPGNTPTLWPWIDAEPGETLDEDDFGTLESAGVRASAAHAAFRDRWPQLFLTDDFDGLTEGGTTGIVATIEARLRATNDAIDLGFVRARADIYRVRQFMLGADEASRLVTSPALADIALREEGARAKSADIKSFLKTAYQTDFQRDPNQPLETHPPAAAVVRLDATPVFRDPTGGLLGAPVTAAFTLRSAPTFVATTAVASRISVLAVQRPVQFTATAVTPTIVAPVAVRSATAAFQSLSIGGLIAQRQFTARDVQSANALPGYTERTVSVAERLQDPPSVEAHRFALEGKQAVRLALQRLATAGGVGGARAGVAIGDLFAPGYRIKPGIDAAGRTFNTLGDLFAHPDDYLDNDVLNDSAAAAGDASKGAPRHEADYFAAAVRAIDNTVAQMRLVEGRIDLYQNVAADARAVADEVTVSVGAADARLRTIAAELAEARHDVATVAALYEEEAARVAALNARRRQVLADYAGTVIFRRARTVDVGRVAPTAAADPGLVVSPVVTCAQEHPAVPDELRRFAALFKDAPVAWFPALATALARLDRLEAARAALEAARRRQDLVRAQAAMTFQAVAYAASPFLGAAMAALTAQANAFTRWSAQSATLYPLTYLDLGATLEAVRTRATLGDLLDPGHGRPALARDVADALDGLARVAACLHERFADAPPATRLRWAEAMSEFDAAVPLRDLTTLDGWTALPGTLRREAQGLVDWLFAQIDATQGDAANAINELVRVALLMAAHAPVDRLIAGRLVTPAPARVGTRLDLVADVSRIRIGMSVLVRDAADRVLAQGVVEDIADGGARARITQSFAPSAMIAANAHIELAHGR